MGLFCSICQRAFKQSKTYGVHINTKTHKILQERQNADPAAFREKLSKRFIFHFSSFISNLQGFTEINVAYQQYLASSKCRIKGTIYRGLHECIAELKPRVALREIGGTYYVKRNTQRIIKRAVLCAELHRSRCILE